jgi:methylated-DNA-[protein]-cysteine S-methyltransferase
MDTKKGIINIGEITTTLGSIWVAVSDRGLVALDIGVDRAAFIEQLQRSGYHHISEDSARTSDVLKQVCQYLQGERKSFDFPIDWTVLTPFQEQVLRATYAIPYGQVATYGEIARQVGKPRAARAVGRAEATNPMPLVIPCHRVIGADGGLHGYGAGEGLKTKAWLLQLEGSRRKP